ncbi:MAG: NAD-dependent epimerase/dehydratase family protein [Acidobacteria bacterium]|nr:NAD-dependent epimerase/dehydratase family protein [Acidobacteriota bacterium]
MKYLVTGASGFIGGCLTRQLLRAGHEVAALVRSPRAAGDLEADGVVLFEGDVRDKSSLRAPMSGLDGLFHLAAWYRIGAKDRGEAYRTNVEGTRNVLETARELGVPRIVYTSTVAVSSDTGGQLVDEEFRHQGPWLTRYERTKWMAHYQVAQPMAEAGLPLVILQPGVVYGPGDPSAIGTAIRQYLQGRLPVTPQRSAFCWAHVEDTAAAHRLAMERGRTGESYIVAGPVHTFREVFELAERLTGIPAPRIHPGPGTMKALATCMKLLGAFLPLPPNYAAESLRVTAGTTYIGDNRKARRELGFAPRSLEEGLRETLDYEMEQLGLAPNPTLP